MKLLKFESQFTSLDFVLETQFFLNVRLSMFESEYHIEKVIITRSILQNSFFSTPTPVVKIA